MLTISLADYLWYVDQALDAMVGIVTDLGDELANRRPKLAGANSPYVILTHCLGVMEFWGGQAVAGRTISRDRAAEFTASGPVAELAERAAAAGSRLQEDLSGLEPLTAPRGAVGGPDALTPVGSTQGGILFHIYEELSQHLGQMELTRDVLLGL
jgi:hypothetical protein